MKRIEVIFTGTAMEFPVIGPAKTLVTPATREHERRAEVETQWRVTALITPRDRAFGMGKWSSTVAHRISACAAHGHPRDVY